MENQIQSLIKDFAVHLQNQDRAAQTIIGYISDLNIFFRWLRTRLGDELGLADVTTTEIQAFRKSMLDAGSKPQTINRKIAALAAFGHWAVQKGLIPSNPVLAIRSVEDVPMAPKWLDKNQRAALIRAIEKDLQLARQRYPRLWVLRVRDAAILFVLLHTGLRLSEVCNLRLSDIRIGDHKGEVTVRSGKGKKYRTVPLNREARKMLNEWIAVRPDDGEDWLFIGQRGERLRSPSVQRSVSRLSMEAGLKDVTPHILRHTFGKSLLDEGVTLEMVAALLGHSNLNTTRIYTTPGKADLEDAVQRISGG